MPALVYLLAALVIGFVSYQAGSIKGRLESRGAARQASMPRGSSDARGIEDSNTRAEKPVEDGSPERARSDDSREPTAPAPSVSDQNEPPAMKTEDLVAALAAVGTAMKSPQAVVDTSELERRISETQLGPEQQRVMEQLGVSSQADSLRKLFVASVISSPGDPQMLTLFSQTRESLKQDPTRSAEALKRAFGALPADYAVQKKAVLQMLQELPGHARDAQALCASSADRGQSYCQ